VRQRAPSPVAEAPAGGATEEEEDDDIMLLSDEEEPEAGAAPAAGPVAQQLQRSGPAPAEATQVGLIAGTAAGLGVVLHGSSILRPEGSWESAAGEAYDAPCWLCQTVHWQLAGLEICPKPSEHPALFAAMHS